MKFRPLWIDYHADAVSRIAEKPPVKRPTILIASADVLYEESDSDSDESSIVMQQRPLTRRRTTDHHSLSDTFSDDSFFGMRDKDPLEDTDVEIMSPVENKRKKHDSPLLNSKRGRDGSRESVIAEEQRDDMDVDDELSVSDDDDAPMGVDDEAGLSEDPVPIDLSSVHSAVSRWFDSTEGANQDEPASSPKQAPPKIVIPIDPAVISRILLEHQQRVSRKRITDTPSNYGPFYFGTTAKARAFFWSQSALGMFSPNEWLRRAAGLPHYSGGITRIDFQFLQLLHLSRNEVLEGLDRYRDIPPSDCDLHRVAILCRGTFGTFSSLSSAAPSHAIAVPQAVEATAPPTVEPLEQLDSANNAARPTDASSSRSILQRKRKAPDTINDTPGTDKHSRATEKRSNVTSKIGKGSRESGPLPNVAAPVKSAEDQTESDGPPSPVKDQCKESDDPLIDWFVDSNSLDTTRKDSGVDTADTKLVARKREREVFSENSAPVDKSSTSIFDEVWSKPQSDTKRHKTEAPKPSLPFADAVKAVNAHGGSDRLASAVGGGRSGARGCLPKGAKVSRLIVRDQPPALATAPTADVAAPPQPEAPRERKRKSRKSGDKKKKKKKRKKERKAERRGEPSEPPQESTESEQPLFAFDDPPKKAVAPANDSSSWSFFETEGDKDNDNPLSTEAPLIMSNQAAGTEERPQMTSRSAHRLESAREESSRNHPVVTPRNVAGLPAHPFGAGSQTSGVQRRSQLAPDFSSMPPLKLLCSETFIETYGRQATTALATGQWAFPTNPPSFEETGERPCLGRRIILVDTPLVDIVGVDIELPGRASILICPSTSLENTAGARDLTIKLLHLVAGERYSQIHVLILINGESITSPLSMAIAQLQMAVIQQSGGPACTTRFQLVSGQSLPAAIALLLLETSSGGNKSVMGLVDEELIRDSRVEERGRFLVRLLPSLTVLGALQCLVLSRGTGQSNNQMTQSDESGRSLHLLLGTDASVRDSLLRTAGRTALSEVTQGSIHQLSVALGACLSSVRES